MEHVEAGARLDSTALKIAVALSGNKKSKYLVRWALEKFATKEHVMFELLHVRARITAIPTPRGSIPISQVRKDVASVYKKEIEWTTREMLLTYKKMFDKKEVQADILVIESDDVATSIAEAVSNHRINKLVIGATASGLFIRKLKKNSLSSVISDKAPSFCAVYAVSKRKLLSTRPSDMDLCVSSRDDKSAISWSAESQSTWSSSPVTDIRLLGPYDRLLSPFQPFQRFRSSSTNTQTLLHERTHSVNPSHNRCVSFEDRIQATGFPQAGAGYATDNQASVSHQDSKSTVYSGSSSASQNIDFELEKLKIELRHVRGMYAMAQTGIMNASQKLSNVNQHCSDNAKKLKELKIKEEEAKEIATIEKEKHIAAAKGPEQARQHAEREASQRQETEMRTEEEAKEKKRLNNFLGPLEQYVKFTWEEVVAATSSFSERFKIGMGSYGSVYKCSLRHMTVAVKVVHADKSNMTKQFEQELEILSKIRHPNLLLLLGACPERGCLIYEYMENGSLEERLLQLNNTSPIPWFERYRIAWEVASALDFLHSTKPKPIVHRDLKPGNILLDHNLVSKIGDAGLSKMLNLDLSHISTLNKATGPVGTFFYIDPEYQRTGMVSPQSDVYAFGIIILQLVTAKPAMGLATMVEKSFRHGKLVEMLDSKAGAWPMDETLELVILALRCTELSCKDRPDLKTEVLPVLGRLKGVADKAKDSFSRVEAVPPNHFICPLSKEIIKNPCVAADGYTYDRKAMEEWLETNDKSPMTNLPLPNMSLLPNYTLLSAIIDWKSSNNQ